MTDTVSREDRLGRRRLMARQLLELLFGYAETGLCELRAFPTAWDRSREVVRKWFGPDAWEDLIERAVGLSRTHDVYIGVGARDHEGGGSKGDVALLGALWADIDCGDGQHKAGASWATTDEALQALQQLAWPPTLVVHSGGGLHAYWRLHEPWEMRSPSEWARAEHLLRRLALLVGGDPQVCDVARILRLPGTLNLKGGKMRPVRVVWSTEHEYDPVDLDDALPATPAPSVPRPALDRERRDELARARFLGRLLPCMRRLAADPPQDGERHACRLRAAAHLRREGYEPDEARLLLERFDGRGGALPPKARADMEAVIRDVWAGRGGEGYTGLGCDDPAWTAEGRRCGEPERALCPVARGRVEAQGSPPPGAPPPPAPPSNGSAAPPPGPAPDPPPEQWGADAMPGDEVLGVVMPPGWALRHGTLHRVRFRDQDDPEFAFVAARPPILRDRYLDLETELISLECEWADPPRTRRATAPRDQWVTSPGMRALTALGLPSHARNAGSLTEWVDALETANARRFAYRRAASRLGWLDDWFLLGDEVLGPAGAPEFLPESAGERQMMHALRPRGTFEGWCQVVLPLALKYPKLLLVLVAAHAPVIQSSIGAANIVIELVGLSSTGKTTAANAGMSAWGNPDSDASNDAGLTRTFLTSQIGIERYLALMGRGLPVQLDDSQSTLRDGDAARILYMVANGVGKIRGAKVGSQVTATWTTTCFVTGEQSIEEGDPREGVGARLVTIRDPFDGSHVEDVEQLVDGIRLHHGHSGRAFVRWLQARPGWREDARVRCDRWREDLVERFPGGGPVARKRRHLAVIMTTADLLEHVLPWPLKDSATMSETLLEALVGWVEQQQRRDQVQESYDHFVGWCFQHRGRFLDPDASVRRDPHDGERMEIFGQWFGGQSAKLYILGPPLLRWAAESRYPLQTTLRAWADRGLLVRGDAGFQTKVTLLGSRQRVYEVRLEAPDAGPDDENLGTLGTPPKLGQAQLPGT